MANYCVVKNLLLSRAPNVHSCRIKTLTPCISSISQTHKAVGLCGGLRLMENNFVACRLAKTDKFGMHTPTFLNP